MGLWVSDDEAYGRYREGMTPILERFGGRFRYDFTVAEVLKNEGGKPINRVFVMTFPDRASSEAFFADPAYSVVRRAHFEGAVTAVTALAAFEQGNSAD